MIWLRVTGMGQGINFSGDKPARRGKYRRRGRRWPLFFPEFPPGLFCAETFRLGPGHVVIVQDLPERGATVFREEVSAGRTAIFAYFLAGKSVLFDEIRGASALGANWIGGKARHGDKKMERAKSRRAYFSRWLAALAIGGKVGSLLVLPSAPSP
jgi:hypothetical protein